MWAGAMTQVQTLACAQHNGIHIHSLICLQTHEIASMHSEMTCNYEPVSEICVISVNCFACSACLRSHLWCEVLVEAV